MFETHHEMERYILDRQQQMISEAERYRLLRKISAHGRHTLRAQLGRLLVDAGMRLQANRPSFQPQPGLDTLQY